MTQTPQAPGALRLSYEETGNEVTVTLVVPIAPDADRAEEIATALASAARVVQGKSEVPSRKPSQKFGQLGRPAQAAVIVLSVPIVGVLLVVLGLIVEAVRWAWS